MNNKDGVISKLAGLAQDKGFYIILMLCVTAISISGYVLFFLPDSAETADTDLGLGQDSVMSSGEDANMPEVPQVDIEVEENAMSEDEEILTQPSGASLSEDLEESYYLAEEDGEAGEKGLFGKSTSYHMPVSGEVIREFSIDALLYDSTMDDWRTHNGIDISCTQGDRVAAIADGTVSDVYEDSLLGYVVEISHDDGMKSIYCNLSPGTGPEVGTEVKGGDVIAAVGSSMKTESLMESHLHLACFKDGDYIDPLSLDLK